MKQLFIKTSAVVLFALLFLTFSAKPAKAMLFCNNYYNMDPVNSGNPNPMRTTYGGYPCNTSETNQFGNPSVVNWKPQIINWGPAANPLVYKIAIFKIDPIGKPWYYGCVDSWDTIDQNKFPQSLDIGNIGPFQVNIPSGAGVPGSGIPAVQLNHSFTIPDQGVGWYQIDVIPSCDGGQTWESIAIAIGGGTFVRRADKCDLNLTPEAQNIGMNQSGQATATFSNVSAGSIINKVDFAANNSLVSVTAQDNSAPYETNIQAGATAGAAVITAKGYVDGNIWCTDTANVSVVEPGAWWRAKDSDVVTRSKVSSSIPSSLGEYFMDIGSGGTPGIPSFTTILNPSTVSITNWNAKADYSAEVPDYDFFRSKGPQNISDINIISNDHIGGPGTFKSTDREWPAGSGYYWYLRQGSLDITGNLDTGNQKVILFVEGGDLTLGSAINISKGRGFFMAIVGKKPDATAGNIYIRGNLNRPPSKGYELEGFYFAEGQIVAESGNNTPNDHPLHIRGSVAALRGLNLNRTLKANNATIPAELFEYAPDQIFNFPKEFLTAKVQWKEIAP